MIPGELANLLNELGYTWPKSDEMKLFELGQNWLALASELQALGQSADAAVQPVAAANAGEAIDAFLAAWHGDDAAPSVLDSGVTGANVIGGALFVCAAVVLALKINVIVQLTLLAIAIIQAIATAAPTFGASLLEIPVFKRLTDIVINMLIDQALGVILGG
ncbi:hypothetical protein [Micromonospora pisi]|nr:hypothetical protein [Micromonospora pisi]